MGKDSQRVRTGSGDRYRVLLLDAEHHTESYGKAWLSPYPSYYDSSCLAHVTKIIFLNSVNDGFHAENLAVEKTLPKAVPGVTPEQARKCWLEARLIGKSVVMVAVKVRVSYLCVYRTYKTHPCIFINVC